ILLWVASVFRAPVHTARSESKFILDARAFGNSGVHANGKVGATDFTVFDEPGKRWERLAIHIINVLRRVVTLLLRAEDFLHARIRVEQREENRNALDNRGSD